MVKESNNKNKQVAKISIFITSIFIIFISISYALISQALTGTKRQVITAGNLQLELQEKSKITLENALPMYDEVGMIQKSFDFTLTNKTTQNTTYSLKLKDATSTTDKLDISLVRYGLTKDGTVTKDLLSNLENMTIDSGTIAGNKTIYYSLRLWIDSSIEDEDLIKGKSLSLKIEVEALLVEKELYVEAALNGCDPVLGETLVPVMIASDGVVTKADTNEEWYNYTNREWANAVVLEDTAKDYQAGETILENDIESYFVWIPRYKYKIFNDGNYTDVTAISDTAVQTIEVEFETKDDEVSNGSSKDEWLSHPAFQAFDTNGFWVGKFETGYRGATKTEGAQVDSNDSEKIVVKPNVFSWRNITIGNAFKVSYEYLRSEESHMMKNTEWGAVAFFHHSIYGSKSSVRINNNTSYKTGYAAVEEPTLGYNDSSISGNQFGTSESVTLPYNTPTGYTASTTGNITGIYDMNGGATDAVMGYNEDASTIGGESEITTIYSDFFTNNRWNKYYDKYHNSSNSFFAYNSRILGDATGEMGPFGKVQDIDNVMRYRASWYGDYVSFPVAAEPWFYRGGHWKSGIGSGIFSLTSNTGNAGETRSFRVVLAP